MEIQTVEQALAKATHLVLATMNDNEEAFNANIPVDPMEARAILLSLCGIATHLAWNLEKADPTQDSDGHVIVALNKALGDYQDYEREKAETN
jgi:hypothetical protein